MIKVSLEKTCHNTGSLIGHVGHFGQLCSNPNKIVVHVNEIPTYGYVDKANNKIINQVKEIFLETKIIQHEYTFTDETKVSTLPILPNVCGYGNSVNSLTAWLVNEGYVAINRIANFFYELTSGAINISEGYIAKIQNDLASKLIPTYQQIQNEVTKEKVTHFDETSISVNGKQATIQGYA
ncbi:MAG: transposase, partial [Mycoplasmataceae bacterium]|nr:transposase [Mycoplasmataceae bacterium]